jgi:hypothetical protein
MDQMTFDQGVQHGIGKILSKITTLYVKFSNQNSYGNFMTL